jgi:nicotinate-nucleotide--dimethylbenzimidazole phosphoribosyltransferase
MSIESLNYNSVLAKKIKTHLDDLTKPVGSLGRLEEFALQYCMIKQKENACIETSKMFVFAGDHGITEQNVCPYPKSVTFQMVTNIASGGAAISVLCKNSGIDLSVVDMGVDADFVYSSKLINCKVARGTKDFSRGYAMTSDECRDAVSHGKRLAKESGADLLGIGEMGIGNSSSASALYAMLLGIEPERTVGAGTGSQGDMLEHKKQVIASSVAMHLKNWSGDALDALQRVGGYEIAGLTGMILGAAENAIPVVVDGFIAGAGALVAMRYEPKVKQYLFFSHASAERFHKAFLDIEGLRPILDLDMRLGEGSGAAIAMQIIRQSMNCYNQMATFSSAGVSKEV